MTHRLSFPRHRLAAALLAGAALASTPALAQDAAKPFDVSFNVGVASDYVFRGASQTDEKPQIYGGVDTTIGSIGYAGVWASNVDFNDSTKAEIDVYAGIKPTLGPVNLDLGVIYYGYAKAPSGSNYEYVEFKVAGSVPVGPATLGAAVYYSDDFFGGTGKATYVELNGSAPLAEKLSVFRDFINSLDIDDLGKKKED